ncbi:MAG: sigma-54 interaction domain-containing protein [Bacillota bacterium]|jgi:arginine utilization regulatory protein
MNRDFFEQNTTITKIFDHVSDAVYFVDQKGRILYLNKTAEKLDGISFEEAKGKTVMELYHLTPSESPLLKVVCNHEPLRDFFFYYFINDREVFQICNTFPVHLQDGFWGAISIQRDVTEMKKRIDRNIALQKKLFAFDEKQEDKEENKLSVFDRIIGDHDSLVKCKEQAFNAAQSDSSVMLTGLTGTGKELFARSIHDASPRRNKPFLAVNCAAIPESLIEGILFGTVKGVYTGAIDRKGLFEEAGGGTLFLDEVNSMPLSSQAKLLRVLEEKVVQPLGGKELIPVDARIISSCNAYPQAVLEKGEIRADLFYRLAVVNIRIPPLSERKSDIFTLAHHFIADFNEKYGKKVVRMDDDITIFFLNYEWPGNVRQLKHCVECAMNLVRDDETTIKWQHLPFYMLEREKKTNPEDYILPLYTDGEEEEVKEEILVEPTPRRAESGVLADIRREERDAIIAALREAGGNVSKAARAMGLSRQTLVYRMKKHRIN